jgi:hypothetical protein
VKPAISSIALEDYSDVYSDKERKELPTLSSYKFDKQQRRIARRQEQQEAAASIENPKPEVGSKTAK